LTIITSKVGLKGRLSETVYRSEQE